MYGEFYPGVMLFMELAYVSAPLEAYEHMLSKARVLAGLLSGDLCDLQRSHLTTQTIAHHKEQIKDFSRKSLAVEQSGA